MATENVLVNNLCSWPLYFKRYAGNGVGDIAIPANARKFPLLSYEEVLAQIQMGNVMFTGTDGMGSHARIQIVDEAQRKALFGIERVETSPPSVLTAEAVKDLLGTRSKGKFKEKLDAMVKTTAEKKMILDLAGQVGAENTEVWKMDALRELAESAPV